MAHGAGAAHVEGCEHERDGDRPCPGGRGAPPAALDALVIGGGAAGLSAALVLSGARRDVLVVDGGSPRNAPAGHVHGYLSSEGISPADLVAGGRKEVEQYGGRFVTDTVETLERDDSGFRATLGSGTVLHTRTVLLATGLVDELPDIDGIREQWGHGVSHCPYCHGYEARDQPIGVIASNPMSLHQAQTVRQWSDDVVLFTHTAATLGPDDAEQFEARGIRVVEGPVAGLVTSGDQLVGVRMASGEVVDRTALFIGPRMLARDRLAVVLGAQTERNDFAQWLVVDDQQATGVDGLWAAGNVTDPAAQVIAAAAAGSLAAISMNAYLVDDDVARAVEELRARAEPDR